VLCRYGLSVVLTRTDQPTFDVSNIKILEDQQAIIPATASAALNRTLSIQIVCHHCTLLISGNPLPLSYEVTLSQLMQEINTLTYVPDAEYFGTDALFATIWYEDFPDVSYSSTGTVTVQSVNDPPSFTVSNTVINITTDGDFEFSGWAQAISAGPANEQSQTVTFSVTRLSDSFTEFTALPVVDSSGNLKFSASESAVRAGGIALFSVIATDDGGTANGGDDESDPIILTIRVITPPDPAIMSVSPDHVPVTGGMSVIITGEHFGNGTEITQVLLCNIKATIVSQTTQSVTVIAATAPDICEGNVSVWRNKGYEGQWNQLFTYDPGVYT